eukprot:scaffold227138_cov47-Prasinocladus_malaysianus.AAC.1
MASIIMSSVVRSALPSLSAGWASLATRSASRFAGVPEAPKDPILGVTEKFLADSNPEKMNLGV